MKLEDLSFTDKQAKRIIAEAAEREAREYSAEIQEEGKISYNQLVQIAQEAQIDPRYLKVSTKQLVREAGGLEKAAMGRMFGGIKYFSKGLLKGYFILPTHIRTSDDTSDFEEASFIGGVPGFISYLGTSFIGIVSKNQYFISIAVLSTLTQIGSGIYEWYRYEKDKLIEEMNGDNSEKESD